MEPTYFPGERVLTFNWKKPNAGDVVVFSEGSKNYLKRIEAIDKEQVRVSGDNKQKSKKFKPIGLSQIVGVVILKY